MFGDSDKGIWQLLGVAERISADLMDQIEMIQHEQRLGVYAGKNRAQRET